MHDLDQGLLRGLEMEQKERLACKRDNLFTRTQHTPTHPHTHTLKHTPTQTHTHTHAPTQIHPQTL